MTNSTMTTAEVPNATAKYFKTITKFGYFTGIPNIWIHDLDFPDIVKKLHNFYRLLVNVLLLILVSCEWAALFTQVNLTEKQRGDLILFSTSHPALSLWIFVTEYHQKRIKGLLHHLAFVLKEYYNDEQVEREMVRKSTWSSAGYSSIFMMALFFYGYDGVTQVIRGEGTFTTVITFWPEVQDTSPLANAVRILVYLVWWAFMTRVCSVYVTLISTLVCLSHQFKNLQSYFLSLNQIWDEELEQTEKEEKYEAAFKVGIKMHSQTLWCTKECQTAYEVILGFQVIITVCVLVLLMGQMMTSDRTMENVLSIVTTATAMLCSNGFVMWNAGDVTIEAAALSTAVAGSGWYNCQTSTQQMRRIITITMTESQRPVILWALGIVELSYGSYVSIVKSSYSVFSVLF